MPYAAQQMTRDTKADRPAAQRSSEGPAAGSYAGMGASPRLQAQARLRESMEASPRVAAQRAVAPSSNPPVIQGWWIMKGVPEDRKEVVHSAAKGNAARGLETLLEELGEDDSLAYLAKYKALWETGAVGFLAGTYAHPTEGFNYRYLFQKVEEFIDSGRRVVEVSDESDGSDHPEGTDTAEEPIDWSDITPQGLARLPAGVLKLIFADLVIHHFKRAGVQPEGFDLNSAYESWVQSGVKTRAQFKALIGLQQTVSEADSGTPDIIQRARVGNSYSHQPGYPGSHGFPYANPIYWRDGQGNIDFAADPANIRAAYNTAFGAAIQAGQINWADPVDAASRVQMSQDLKNPRKGVMPSGKQVDLPKASRAQHFAIANMLSPHQNGGGWTWHHLTPKYQMVLVDTKVHSKHGHNGGVYIW